MHTHTHMSMCEHLGGTSSLFFLVPRKMILLSVVTFDFSENEVRTLCNTEIARPKVMLLLPITKS